MEVAAERIGGSIVFECRKDPNRKNLIVGREYSNEYCATIVRNYLRNRGLNPEVRTAIEENGSDARIYNLDKLMDKLMPKREIIGY